jgi:hypothetical protein
MHKEPKAAYHPARLSTPAERAHTRNDMGGGGGSTVGKVVRGTYRLRWLILACIPDMSDSEQTSLTLQRLTDHPHRTTGLIASGHTVGEARIAASANRRNAPGARIVLRDV